MAKKKPIVSPLGQWAYPGEVTIIPSSNITMKGVNYPVLGVDDLGNSQMMMPGQDYNFPGQYVTEIPQMGKGGLRQWFAEEWTDVKTGKPCGRSGKEKGSRPYPACRPKKRVNETTPKTTSEMSSAEKAKFKREKTSGKRIDYNHKRREDGGETGWLDEYQTGGTEQNPERMQGIDIKRKKKNVSDSPRYQYDDKGNLLYTPELSIWPYASDGSSRDEFLVNPKLSVQNLNPTLEEFINVASPYYPIDNKLVTDPKINLQSSNYQRSLEQEYVLPQIVGKSFGNLPIVKDDGYSPNRRWVSNLRAKDTAAKFGKDSYAYVLKTNPNNLVDYSTKHAIEAAVSSNDKNFYDYLEKNNYSLNTVQELEKNRPDQIWNRAEQMRVEMRNNPEIMSWANLHNVDLGYKEKGKGDDKFAPKIPESIYANRLVKAGLPTNRPDYEYKPMETYIVQDPSKFDLAGYFPMGSIAKDAEQKVLNKKIPGKLKREYIYSNSPEYFEKEAYIKDEMARRMGINPSAFDSGEYLIHYNQSPITEYTPGKKYGGWLEQYQNAGEVLPKSIGAYTNQFNEEISGLKDWYEANRKRIGEIVPEAYLTYNEKSYPKPYGPEYDPMEYNFSAVKDYYNNKLIPGVKTLYDPITDTLSEQYVPPVFPFNFPKLDFTFNDNESPSTLEQGIANRFVYNLPPDYDRFATVKNYDANPPFVADWKGKQNINISNEPIDVDRFTAKNDPSTILSHETSHYLNKNNPEVFLFNRTKLAEMGITDTEGFKNYYGAGVVAKPSNTIDGAAKIYSGYDNDRKEDELLSDAYALKQDMRKKGFYDYTKGEKLTPEIWNKYKKEYGDNYIINRFIPVFEDQGQNNIEKLYNTNFPPLILNNNYNITDPFSPHLKNTKETPTFKTSDERIIHLLNQIVKNKDQGLNVAKYGGWLNKYQNAGEVPFDVERMQGADIRKKRSWLDKLKGVVHRGERAIGLDPYNERSDDFFEQWARRINTATGGKDWYKQPNDASGAGGLPTAIMETVMAPFSAPQLGATYGVTGKVQTPSQAMNIQNPVGAFLTDAVLDPTNLVGAGIAKNLGSGALRNMIRNRSRGTRPDFTPNVSNQLPDPPSELILNPNTGQFDAYYDSSRPYFDEWVRMMNNNATDLDVSNLFANNPIDVASSIDLRKLKKSKNLSGLTKDDVLKNASPKDKEVLSKMSESEFEQTVLKPTGEIAVYEPAVNLGLGFNTNTRNLTLRDSIPMSADEYTDIFNSRLDRLNEIIAGNNKSGLEYSVKGLSPSGALTFNTPAQIEKLAPNTKVLNELKSRGLIDSKGNVDPIAQDYIDRWGIAGNRNIPQGESTWMLDINPGQWRGEVEDIANAEYFKAIPGLNMRNTTASVFSDALPRRGTGTYNSINQYLKELDLGRVKPGFNSQSQSSSGLWQDAIKKGKAFGYFNNPTTVYGSMRTFAPLGVGAAAASQLPEQKNGGWLNKYK